VPQLVFGEMACGAAALCIFGTCVGAAFTLRANAIAGGLMVAMAIATSFVMLQVLAEAAFVCAVHAAIADPHELKAELNAVIGRTRGRKPMLLVATAVPLMIIGASSPTPFAQELVGKAMGPDGEAVFLACITLAGVTIAILLGSALLAASYAVILGTPDEPSASGAPSP